MKSDTKTSAESAEVCPEIRLAAPSDGAGMQTIYAPIVQETPISFEMTPPTVAEMQARVEKTLATYPWLVCTRAGRLLGYAYASQHRSRAAYQWAVDVSVYVAPTARRLGIGQALYISLFGVLRLQGFFHAYAGIALPNPASVRLHETLGFMPVGVYRQVGHKLGRWHDVGWWHLALQLCADQPDPPRPLPGLETGAEFQAALSAGLKRLQPRSSTGAEMQP